QLKVGRDARIRFSFRKPAATFTFKRRPSNGRKLAPRIPRRNSCFILRMVGMLEPEIEERVEGARGQRPKRIRTHTTNDRRSRNGESAGPILAETLAAQHEERQAGDTETQHELAITHGQLVERQ